MIAMSKSGLPYLSPERCDAALWILCQVAALPMTTIAEETRISLATLRRIKKGYSGSPRTREALKELLLRVRDEMAQYTEFGKLTAEFTAYRTATYALINAAIRAPSDMRREHEPTPRERAVMFVIRDFIKSRLPRPTNAQDVFDHFHGTKTSRPLIYRAAQHLGIQRDYVGFGPDKLCYWRLPDNTQPSVGGPP